MSSKSAILQQFNEEINEFYKNLKQNQYSDEEIREILAPITVPIINRRTITATICIITTICFIYWLVNSEGISWHVSAISRIILIKLLPYWDWTYLKNQKCLIPRSDQPIAEITFNCNFCENQFSIDKLTVADPDIIQNRYIDVDNPVIIPLKLNWTSPDTLVDSIIAEPILADSIPCNLATNTNNLATIAELFEKLELFDQFFIHFQNCDFEAMKHFRKFTPRPPFLPVELAPIQYNWFLWNRNYNATHFKRVELVEKVTVFAQLTGKSLIRLQPRKNCFEICNDLMVELEENKSMIFTSLWDLEYKPDGGNNMAVILETH